MIQRHQVIATLCHLLQTEYVSLLGQRKVGKNILINQLLSSKTAFFGMKFISVGLPQNVQSSSSFMEIFLQRLIHASAQVSPREELQKEVNKLIETQISYPSDIRLRSLLSLLGNKTTSSYLIIILQDLAEVSEEPLKELLLLLREYHNQRNNPGEAGAKLRFLVTGGFRLWNLSFNKTSSISPFNISKRLFLSGCTHEEIQSQFPVYSAEIVAQIHSFTDGIPALVEKAVNISQDSESLSVYFAAVQDNWNLLSDYAKELLKELVDEENFPKCRPDYDCLQIPNFEANYLDWAQVFWAGFLKLKYGELMWRSPIHKAFVLAQKDLLVDASKFELLEANLLERSKRLKLALSRLSNPDIFNEIVEELFSLSVQLNKSELISSIEMLIERRAGTLILDSLRKSVSNSECQSANEIFNPTQSTSNSLDYEFVISTILATITRDIQTPGKSNGDYINSGNQLTMEALDSNFEKASKFQNVNQSQAYQLPKRDQKVEVNKDSLIDFAIITAIKTERLAVLKAFEIDENRDRAHKGSRTYWHKHLLLKNGGFYEIIVAQSLDVANVNAAILTNDTLHHWNPTAVLMVGIAAAAKPEPKQHLGNLVIGKEIYYYETGKVIAEGNLPEPKQIPVDATLLDRVQALPDSDFSILAERPDGTNKRPGVELGVIASGDKVIADATERDAIASANRKIMAIEMEGYGVISAAWQSFDHVRCLVIRALCDYADSSKHDKWHNYAAATAASFTKHFLLDEPLEPRNSSTFER